MRISKLQEPRLTALAGHTGAYHFGLLTMVVAEEVELTMLMIDQTLSLRTSTQILLLRYITGATVLRHLGPMGITPDRHRHRAEYTMDLLVMVTLPYHLRATREVTTMVLLCHHNIITASLRIIMAPLKEGSIIGDRVYIT